MPMRVIDAQREIRTVFRGGFAGQLVSGALWLAAAAAATWGSHALAVIVLLVGGAFIFPLTQLGLRLAGRPAGAGRDNPLNMLAMQVAFTVPLAIPIVLTVASCSPAKFFPAMMIVVGAHYLPFVFLYGMPHFWALAGLLVGGGVVLGWAAPAGAGFASGGWATGAALVAFAFVGWRLVIAEERRAR
jgi:hypothetical protein